MSLLRSERVASVLLLVAAAVGLLLANLPFGADLIAVLSAHPHVEGGLDLSIEHWISDGLLAVFFFIVAVELRRELVIGELNYVAKALLPALAAIGGVVVPALVYLAFTAGSGLESGWPVPTATDIAFALGILAVFGSAIPTRVRVFLLALAVLDDLVAILIIAFFFTSDVRLEYLGFAAVTLTAFGAGSRILKPRSAWVLARRPQWPIVVALCVLAAATWYFVLQSGIHATIAGVLLGLVIARRPGGRANHLLEPWSNGVVLPLFALTAAMVPIPSVRPSELSPAFWGILVALPVGKFVGISLVGLISNRLAARNGNAALRRSDVAVIGVLGGVGFTVSLLMSELAFRGSPDVADEGTLAVLLGSAIAIVASGFAVTALSAHYRRLGARRGVGGAFSR